MAVSDNRKFRFGIMGAGNIAGKFCDAVSRIPDCEVAAVSGKSEERAARFAQENGIPASYGNYEQMLEKERLDCVYIATMPNTHFELCMLCLKHRVPVLCEKAMFQSEKQAQEAFGQARRNGIFMMEAMWSRFLPAVRQAKAWLEEGRIGNVSFAEINIGYCAPEADRKRYLDPALGGGVSFHVTVYACELADFLLGKPTGEAQTAAVWTPEGTDLTDHVVLPYGDALAALTCSYGISLEERAVLYGDCGKIVIPYPHFASEAACFPADGGEPLRFRDETTQNGFVPEILETMACVRAGKTESDVVPHALTLSCAGLFDRIQMNRKII